MTMLETILIVGNVFALGYIIGQSVMAYRIRNALKKLAENNGIDFEEMEQRFLNNKSVSVIKVPNLFTESTNNSILLYNKDTGKFIGQASSLEELAENVYKFDKVSFAFVSHNDAKFWFVEGKVKDNLQEIE